MNSCPDVLAATGAEGLAIPLAAGALLLLAGIFAYIAGRRSHKSHRAGVFAGGALALVLAVGVLPTLTASPASAGGSCPPAQTQPPVTPEPCVATTTFVEPAPSAQPPAYHTPDVAAPEYVVWTFSAKFAPEWAAALQDVGATFAATSSGTYDVTAFGYDVDGNYTELPTSHEFTGTGMTLVVDTSTYNAQAEAEFRLLYPDISEVFLSPRTPVASFDIVASYDNGCETLEAGTFVANIGGGGGGDN